MADGPQLYAILDVAGTPPPLEKLAPLFEAPGLPSLLVRPSAATDASPQKFAAAIKPLVARAQEAGTAVLIAESVELAAAVAADGVHLTVPPPALADEDAQAALAVFRAAREALGPEAIVGIDPGASRHVAMLLAEEGADYIAFGPQPEVTPGGIDDGLDSPETQEELVNWWAEVFEIPVVAFGVADKAACRDHAAAGADFVAVAIPAAASPADLADWLTSTREMLSLVVETGGRT